MLKDDGRYITHCGMLLMAAILLLGSAPAKADDNESQTSPSAESTPCKGLKPYNNLDELLYQFYINLDSDCLFTMPVAELEKIWDTKIVPQDLRFDSDAYYKPYRSDRDAFYIYVTNHNNRTEFYIQITKEYEDKYATLFPDGKLPKLLPKPKKTQYSGSIMHQCRIHKIPKVLGEYADGQFIFYWLKEDKVFADYVGMIYLNGYCRSIHDVMVFRTSRVKENDN